MNHRNLDAACWQSVLIQLKFVGGFQRVIATDGNQRVDAQRSQTFIGSLQWGHLFFVLNVIRAADKFAGVRSSGSDHDAFFAASSTQHFFIEVDEVFAFHQWLVGRVIDQAGVTVLDSDDFDAVVQAGNGTGRNDGVRTGSRATREQQSDFLDTVRHEFRF